jgi:hypothetical protein
MTTSVSRSEIMNKTVSRALWGAFFVGGLTVLGAGAAHAADTSGEDGTASGNQVGILGDLPVTIGGNSVSILGDSESSGSTTAAPTGGSTTGSSTTNGEEAIAGGNQIVPDIVAPIIASGNAISVLGDSSTEGTHASAPTDGSTDGTATTTTTTGEDAIAGGNQVMPDATLPITVGGNSISVIGDNSTEGTHTSAPTDGSTDGTATTTTTTGEDAIAGGNQVMPDVDAPILVTGNDVSVIRDDSLLQYGMLDGGVLEGGLLEDGLLGDGLFDNGIADGPIVTIGLVEGMLPTDPATGDTVVSGVVSDPLLSAPIIEGPLLGDVDVDVIAPVGDDAVVGDDTTGAVGTEGTDGTMTPLLATAAMSPTMMLAATGVEALPLIGGIALMLGTGLGLVAIKRMNHVIN